MGTRLKVMSRHWTLLIAVALLFATACTSQSRPTATLAPEGTLVPEGGLLTQDCDDAGACVVGFTLDDGVFYNLGCTAVKDSAVTATVIGRGELQYQEVTVNLIEGVDRSVMVAVSLPGGLCRDDSVALSGWSMAFSSKAAQAAIQEAVCQVGELTDGERAANGC